MKNQFQLILNPIRDWNGFFSIRVLKRTLFQLILNPIRDWNLNWEFEDGKGIEFQLILNPIRDWNKQKRGEKYDERVPINLKPY